MANTFARRWVETTRRTAYVTCNPLAQHLLVDRGDRTPGGSGIQDYFYRYGSLDLVYPQEMGLLEHVWRAVAEDDRYPSIDVPALTPPRYITDRGISLMRESAHDRVILHYIQPHHPYTANAMQEDRDLHDYEGDPFNYIKETGDRGSVFEAYLDDLRYVLDDVALLLDNVDSEDVVISADHGGAFGEYGVYSHPPGSLHPKVRRVPWVRTSAFDSNTYEPSYEPRDEVDYTVTEALGDLGYLNG